MCRVKSVSLFGVGEGVVVWVCWSVGRHVPIPSYVIGGVVGRSRFVLLAMFVPVCGGQGPVGGVAQNGAVGGEGV